MAILEIIKNYSDFLTTIKEEPEDVQKAAIKGYHTALMKTADAIINTLEKLREYSAGILEEMKQ